MSHENFSTFQKESRENNLQSIHSFSLRFPSVALQSLLWFSAKSIGVKMVSVAKCCVCLRLSTGGIILGSFGAFSSLLLVMVVGGFLLNYDNFVARSYEKGGGVDTESKESQKLAVFLETYKNGEKFDSFETTIKLDVLFDSRCDIDGNISRSSVH